METIKNIQRAIAGESMARNKYTFFASAARKEGFEQIAAIFEETAGNEMEHAKRLMKLLKDPVETSSIESFDFPTVKSTVENLAAAATGENHEWTAMYPDFAKVAKEEGQTEAKTVFTELADVEERHEARYIKLKENIENNVVFTRDAEVEWKCRNCGYIHKGLEAPEICPACAHPQSYYELFVESY